MLHFAYGSNMHRAVMRRHAPNAEPLGVASLTDYRFVITGDGYASVEPARTHTVQGVLWRLTPRDRVGLDNWENIAGGLYSRKTLSVLAAGRRMPVLVYLARPRGPGRPRAGYMELVLDAARAWNLPPDYIASLRRWLPAQPLGAGGRSLKEFGWT
ncbi:MAG: gamma-glutamylcyclotransferase family protein [Xanthobacteraceae bacterium]